MAVAIVPLGKLTTTGTLLFMVVPLPSCPNELSPQARTDPVDVRARLNVPPAATDAIVVPTGRLTGTGTPLSVVVPLPSWPELLVPQASTVSPARFAPFFQWSQMRAEESAVG